jgi:hypothetical protein
MKLGAAPGRRDTAGTNRFEAVKPGQRGRPPVTPAQTPNAMSSAFARLQAKPEAGKVRP